MSTYRSLKDLSLHSSSPLSFPLHRKNVHSVRKTCRITGQCPILASLLIALEKVVADLLNSHINSANTSNHYQSTHKKFHSTETALLKIYNDILSLMDDGRVMALTLTFSTAFDTVDHTITLRRLDD